jgi:hypothetical protein
MGYKGSEGKTSVITSIEQTIGHFFNARIYFLSRVEECVGVEERLLFFGTFSTKANAKPPIHIPDASGKAHLWKEWVRKEAVPPDDMSRN